MVRLSWIILSFAAIAVTFPSFTLAQDISIKIDRRSSDTFRISITFVGENDGRTEIRLPNEWGGQNELYNAVKGLTVKGDGAKIEDTAEPHIKVISHVPSAEVTLHYELVQDFAGALTNRVRYRPVVNERYVHWIGNAVWILPAWEDTRPLEIRTEWSGLPNSWSIANSFAAGTREQRFTRDIRALRSSVWIAGDFRILERPANGKPVFLAIRGEWKFSDEELSEAVARIITAQRSFWKDDSQEHFLVTLVPILEAPNALSFGGTGLHDSFALFSTQNVSIDRLRSILAHEYAHNWIPGRLGRMPKDDRSMYWFSEGFTEYYTYLTMFRAGLISQETLVAAYNDLIREYYLSPVRNEPNERIIRDFWSDPKIQRLPYLRGFMLALNWNAAIRKASGGKRSLDDLMFDLMKTSDSGKRELSRSLFAERVSQIVGRNVAGDFERQIERGETIVPAADALGSDVELRMESLRTFELGFDLENLSKTKEFSGVKPDTAAYHAGLRNGQKLIGGLSVALNDPTKHVELKVADGDAEKVIKYLPAAAEAVNVPQFFIPGKTSN